VDATTSSALITGVITTYDRSQYLAGAIASVLAQTTPVHEILVVDDCSSHDVAAILEPFGDKVRHIRLDTNQGPSAARNVGVQVAAGDFVAFLDDDDRWRPEKMERQTALLAAGYEAALCGWQPTEKRSPQIAPVVEITADALRSGNTFCGTTGLVARRDVLLEEPFDEAIRWSEDWDLFVRLARRRPLGYVRDALFDRTAGENHQSLTAARRRITLDQLIANTQAAQKHRAWLGEWSYHNAIARSLLSHLSTRSGKAMQIRNAVRHAGPAATVATLLQTARLARRRRR